MKAKRIIQKTCLSLMLMMAMLFAMNVAVAAADVTFSDMKQTDATKSTATVSWTSTASGYYVYVDEQFVKEQTGTSYKVSGMAAGSSSEVAVIGYSEKPEVDPATVYNMAMQGIYSGFRIKVFSTPGKPGNVANAKYNDTFNWNPLTSNAVKVGWSINAKDKYYADGWQVVISTVDGKKKLKTLTVKGVESSVVSTSFNLKSVKNKGFSMKVRGYIVLNGQKKYGVWSGTKVVIPQVKSSAKLTAKNRSVKLSWKKVSNAVKYEVYVCKDTTVSNPKFKKVKTLGKNVTSYTLKKVPLYKRYGLYVKAIVKYGKKTYKTNAAMGYHSVYFYRR